MWDVTNFKNTIRKPVKFSPPICVLSILHILPFTILLILFKLLRENRMNKIVNGKICRMDKTQIDRKFTGEHRLILVIFQSVCHSPGLAGSFGYLRFFLRF